MLPHGPLHCAQKPCLLALQHVPLPNMRARLQVTAELEARLAEVEAQHATLQQQLQEAQDRVTALETQLAEAQAVVASGRNLQPAGTLYWPLFAQLQPLHQSALHGWALTSSCQRVDYVA